MSMNYCKLNDNEWAAIECIEDEVGDARNMAKAGLLQGEARGCVIRSILKCMDEQEPELTTNEREHIAQYVQEEYGISI